MLLTLIQLLPGMYSPPINAVPKPHSCKLQLINDLSAGLFSLNLWIKREDATLCLDNLQDFGSLLKTARTCLGHPPAYIFKSDVSQAYCRWLMHPLCQIRKVITIDGLRHVDWCMVFSSYSLPHIWCMFMGLVIWIVIHMWKLLDLLHYMDNAFRYKYDPKPVYYTPYNNYLLEKQAGLLLLWDKIGLPHERHKQVFGPAIKIIGFWVDPQDLSFFRSTASKAKLITSIQNFVNTSTLHTHPLMEWQHILGWINWGLNVFPLLCPSLQCSYEKISGKSHAHALVNLNR